MNDISKIKKNNFDNGYLFNDIIKGLKIVTGIKYVQYTTNAFPIDRYLTDGLNLNRTWVVLININCLSELYKIFINSNTSNIISYLEKFMSEKCDSGDLITEPCDNCFSMEDTNIEKLVIAAWKHIAKKNKSFDNIENRLLSFPFIKNGKNLSSSFGKILLYKKRNNSNN